MSFVVLVFDVTTAELAEEVRQRAVTEAGHMGLPRPRSVAVPVERLLGLTASKPDLEALFQAMETEPEPPP